MDRRQHALRGRPLLVALACLAAVLSALPSPAAHAATAGRSGTGTVLGELPTMTAPVGRAMKGRLTTAVANLPNRATTWEFTSSMRKLTAYAPDFITLNEVSGRSIDLLRTAAPGYDGYRDPVKDPTVGGVQSMNNVVMWRTNKWRLLDGGRVKIVDDDQIYWGGSKVTWDRYATWATLQRRDGAILSVVSTHQMTNPEKYPRQWGDPELTRVEQYAQGMDILVRLSRRLATRGPVLVGGDLNSHLSQGSWTAPAKMMAAGYEYAKNRGVLYLFHQSRLGLLSSTQVSVASDHPALVAQVALNGQGPS